MGCSGSRCWGGDRVEPEPVEVVRAARTVSYRMDPLASTSTQKPEKATDAPEEVEKKKTKKRDFLVLANPNSGKGNSVKYYHTIVVPTFERFGLTTELVITEKPKHAKELVQTINLNCYRGIIILSGDGLVFEVLNGIIQRDDWEESLQFPIGVIPTGSGNALVGSMFYASGTPIRSYKRLIANATTSIPTCIHRPVTLFHVETDRRDEHLVGFLSLTWGMIADIDTESEKYRKILGSSRFSAGGAECAIKMKTYRGKVSYIPAGSSEELDPEKLTSLVRKNSLSSSVRTRNSQQPASLNLTDSDKTRRSRASTTESKLRSGHVSAAAVSDLPPEGGATTTAVASSAAPCPSPWVVVEADDWLTVVAVTMSHLSTDVLWCREACTAANRPLLYLTLMRRSDLAGGRLRLLRWLIALGPAAKHANFSFFKVLPVVAVRIEPATADSPLVVDGEAIEARWMQATATHHSARIMSPAPAEPDVN